MQRRGKQKERFFAHIKTANFYKYYSDLHFREYEGKKVIIDRESKYYVDYSTFSTVLDLFNLKIRELILKESFDFNMPYRMGMLGIRKKKLTPWIDKEGKLVNPLPIDWKATNALWDADPIAKQQKKLVRHYNKHTKGYVAKWYYTTRHATYKWKLAYRFIPCRTGKVALGNILTDENNNIDYYIR